MPQTPSQEDLRIHPEIIHDSRGKPTVQVTLYYKGLVAVGDVPAGASKGEDEAQTVPVEQAIKHIETTLSDLLRKHQASFGKKETLIALEQAIIDAAGSNYQDLGANATLPVSRALWRLFAAIAKNPLYAYIEEVFPQLKAAAPQRPVRFLMNIFNGGLHALQKKDGETLGIHRIDIQEIMVVPNCATTYQKAFEMGEAIDAALKTLLHTAYGKANVTRADEAGFSVKGLGDSDKAIDWVFQAIEKAGFLPGKDVQLSLDVAASSFYDPTSQRYHFQGKLLDSQQMITYLLNLADKYKGRLLSIEDGLAENDWQAWQQLSDQLQKRDVVTIGDDLFVTQLPRLRRGIAEKSAHAILIKVNQNGSVYGTLKVIEEAYAHGMACVVSHRSGETLDDSIADLAYAIGALGLKTGDPQPVVDFPNKQNWVRRQKYLRMIAIEQSLNQ